MPSLQEVLGRVKAEEAEIDFDNYQDASEYPPPAPAGVYTFKQVKADFNVNDAGNLVAILDHEIVAPGDPNDGHKLNFDRVSNKTFDRGGVRVSQMADQIRALGIVERPRTAEDYGNAIASGVGSLWKGQLDWEAGCNHKDTEFEVPWDTQDPEQKKTIFRLKGMKKFPLLPNGQHADVVECPTCKTQVRGREKVVRRIPA